jgi:molybdate transport system regulatory protein
MSGEKPSSFKSQCRLWITNDKGDVLFGWEHQLILELIRKTGSMNKAAKELGISYRTLWGKIREAERRLGYKLVMNRLDHRRGGSQLTKEGETLYRKYKQFRQESMDAIQAVFDKIFPSS